MTSHYNDTIYQLSQSLVETSVKLETAERWQQAGHTLTFLSELEDEWVFPFLPTELL